jgi:hypothetical protein
MTMTDVRPSRGPYRVSCVRRAFAVLTVLALTAGCTSKKADVTPVPGGSAAPPVTAASSTSAKSGATGVTTTLAGTTTATAAPAVASTVGPDPTTTILAPPSTLIRQADLVTDPASDNNRRTVRPQDKPILDAYRQGLEAANIAISRWPLDAADPILKAAPFTGRLREAIVEYLAERSQKNLVLDISGGLTLRPYVLDSIDSSPTRAIVWDCQVDATFWKDRETGVRAAPETGFPNLGAPGAEIGIETVMVLVDGRWLKDLGGHDEVRACAA